MKQQSSSGQIAAGIVGGTRRKDEAGDGAGSRGRRRYRPGGGQTVPGVGAERWHEVIMNSSRCEVSIIKHASRIAEEVSRMTRGSTLQEAVRKGAREQWEQYLSWQIGLTHGCRTAEPHVSG